jgi:hypothetical protein
MTMRVYFLKDFGDHKTGNDLLIPRDQARKLCEQEIAVPWSVKQRLDALNVEETPPEPGKKDKPKKKRGRNKAISTKTVTMETAVTD